MPISSNSIIYVAGHRGMVGSAVCRQLKKSGFSNVITANRRELDLTDSEKTKNFLIRRGPDVVIVAAAKVGGINANNNLPADFILDNLMIECNLISGAKEADVGRLVFLGSSCIYPKQAPQPIKENALLSGHLELTNEPYAVAKIAGIKLCESYNRQHGTDYRSLMPTNLYGPNDNFDLSSSHVIPALLRKFHEAKLAGARTVKVWGSGRARREFLHVDDLAKATVHFMELDKGSIESCTDPQMSHINIGTGVDLSIADLAALIGTITAFKGDIVFDTSMPDGTILKRLDVSLAARLGWKATIELRSGLESTYQWYQEQLASGAQLA